jgi:hypothetical protein
MAIEVHSGKRVDDPHHYESTRGTLKEGIAVLGDCKMAALQMRASIQLFETCLIGWIILCSALVLGNDS